MSPETPDNRETLRQRRDYLTTRIAGKSSLGWETTYDERERAALTWALGLLPENAKSPEP